MPSKGLLILVVLGSGPLLSLCTSLPNNRTCSPESRDASKKCSTKFNNICAFFNGDGCYSEICQRLTLNRCTACKDESVRYSINGGCDGDQVYCDSNNRPDTCDDREEPVCGFFIGENKYDLKHKVMSNPCHACQDPKVQYYQPGACVFTCKRNPLLIVECDGTTVIPVCGAYKKNGKTHHASIKNGCVACYNVGLNIETYTDGLCEGDEGISCENEPVSFLQGRISPVCGAYEKGCTEASCRKTFSEPFVACRYPSVLLYSVGICPGDEGISCDPFRPGAEVDSFINEFNYGDVCGYSSAGCDDKSCRKTYQDQHVACSDASVLFFTEGPC